jgi:hypothetical protein
MSQWRKSCVHPPSSSNDGRVFHLDPPERLWPWADAAATAKLTTS